MSTNRTVYMHLLDGKPAEFDAERRYLYFAGRVIQHFAKSLQQIRREQEATIREARKWGENQREWAEAKRYSYIRVILPFPPRD